MGSSCFPQHERHSPPSFARRRAGGIPIVAVDSDHTSVVILGLDPSIHDAVPLAAGCAGRANVCAALPKQRFADWGNTPISRVANSSWTSGQAEGDVGEGKGCSQPLTLLLGACGVAMPWHGRRQFHSVPASPTTVIPAKAGNPDGTIGTPHHKGHSNSDCPFQ